jgi:hypothetical protein
VFCSSEIAPFHVQSPSRWALNAKARCSDHRGEVEISNRLMWVNVHCKASSAVIAFAPRISARSRKRFPPWLWPLAVSSAAALA